MGPERQCYTRRHMQARLELFRATHVVGEDPDDFDHSPECAASWCQWLVVDSVAYAARQSPRNFPGGAPRLPRRAQALPALGSIQTPQTTLGNNGALSAQQTAKIAQKREEAVFRKQEKQHQKRVELPRMPSDDDDVDPFGHGTSLWQLVT